MTVWLLVIGFISILGQVVLLRELSVAFYGSELIYVLALGVWLLWTALGATLGRRHYAPRPVVIDWLLLLFALLLLGDLVAIRGLRVLVGGVLGADLSFPQQLAGMMVALLPIGLLLGLLFQWAAKLYTDERRTLAAAYAVESAGGMLGGAAATLALMAGWQNLTIAVVCSLLALAVVVGVRIPRGWPGGTPRGLKVAAGLTALLLLVALLGRGALDCRTTGWNHPLLLDTCDTPYGRATVTGSAGQISLFNSGALSAENEGTSAEEFVHLAALQHPDPQAILVLGGGVEGLVREAALHAPARLDHVELDIRAWRLAGAFLDPAHFAADLRAPTRLIFADPRRFLQDTDATYDLILVGMPEPSSVQANRYYTADFYALCARRLTPDGVLACRLRAAENIWTPLLLRRATSILRAMQQNFADVVVLPGATNLFIASPAPLPRDPALLAGRLSASGISPRLVSAGYLRYIYTNDRFADTATRLAAAQAPVNTDSRPICYQYTLLLWLAQYYPALTLMEPPAIMGGAGATPSWRWLGLLIVPLTFALARRRPAARRALLAAIAGFLGMVLESVIILDYQMRSGVLYQDLGLLLMLFMGGLALGAYTMHRVRAAADRRLSRWFGSGLLAAFAGLNLLLIWLLGSGAGGGLVLCGAALLGGGALVAGLFAYASFDPRREQRLVVSPLYAADLVGGCLGSLLASLWLTPVLGLIPTAAGMVVLAGLAVVLI